MIILQFFVNSADATKVNLSQTFEPISWTHLLGTDDYGRDLFTRVIVGARSTLFITILTLIAIVIIGVTLGLLAGYKKGWIERIILRIVDIGLSIPEFIIMIALASFFQPSIWNLVIAITIIKWMNYTRLTRSIVNSEITKPYIKMAKLFHVPIDGGRFRENHFIHQLIIIHRTRCTTTDTRVGRYVATWQRFYFVTSNYAHCACFCHCYNDFNF